MSKKSDIGKTATNHQSNGSCLKYIINTEVVVQPEAFDFIEKETLVFSYEVFKIS